MKKLSAILVGMSLVAGAVMAAEPVTSVNAVGYVKVNVPAGGKLAFVSVNFDPVGAAGPSESISIQDVLKGQMVGGWGSAQGDNIILWDIASQKYVITYLAADLDPSVDGKWLYDGGIEIATNMLKNGSAFWIRNNQSYAQDVVFSGQVVDRSTGTNSNTFLPGMNMFGYPFSMSVDVNSNLLGVAATGGWGTAQGDNIIFWDVVQQKYIITYLAADLDSSVDGKWLYDGGVVIATNKLEMGTGYWFRRQNAGNVQWNEPQTYSIK
jgi:hypothetical protein